MLPLLNKFSVSCLLCFQVSPRKWKRGTLAIYCTLPVLFVMTYTAWGQRGCVEGRGQSGQREVEWRISLPVRTWALSPYGLSPAGQQTSRQLGLGRRDGRTMGDSTNGIVDIQTSQKWWDLWNTKSNDVLFTMKIVVLHQLLELFKTESGSREHQRAKFMQRKC